MEQHKIYVTQEDAYRLRDLVYQARSTHYRGSRYLDMLQSELDRAVLVQPQHIPADVITMNSTVRLLDLEAGEEVVYTLVFPEQADVTQGRISVLAPIGTAMLGYRSGDVFDWHTPDGLRKFKVIEVLFQPESFS